MATTLTCVTVAPLAKLSSKTGKLNWIWGQIQQRSFAEAKAILYKHAMLAYSMFEKHQQQDKVLQILIKEELNKHPNGTLYTTKEVEGVYLIHKNNKIIVPQTLQERVMEWYHTILVHP